MKASAGQAPTPDPKIGEAALRSAAIGEEWLAFSKDAFRISQERQAELDDLTKQVTEMQLGLADEAAAQSREDRARYKEKFQPIEDEFVAEAADYASPERQDAAAAEARADVQSAAARAKDIARREAVGLGIDPRSGRYAGIERSAELATALADAGAANTARQGVRDKGLALKGDVVNLGRGLPTSAAALAGQAAGLGGGAVELNAANNAQQMSAAGLMNPGFSGAMQGYGSQAGILGGLHNSNVGVWQTKAEMDARSAQGFGEFLGSVVGLGGKLAMMSDKKKKTDKKPVPDGEALEAVKSMPVESWRYKEGEGDGGAHVGTYAQDFQRETGAGDGETIPVIDAIGITMKAVQDLDAKVTMLQQHVVGLDGKPRAQLRRAVKKPTPLKKAA